MWKLGTFESVYQRPTLREQFAALREDGLGSVQFDWISAEVDPWQAPVPERIASSVAQDARESDVTIPAVSGTYNMAHPDASIREHGHEGLARVIRSASPLGASFVTLCTGTRSEASMWRGHPDNDTADAWEDCRGSIVKALGLAQASDVTLLVEPEPANVVSSAVRARRLLDELAHPSLKIVLDPANIVLSDRSRSPATVLEEAFDLLGPDIAFAHAKDLSQDGEFGAAGTGIVPWDLYQELLTGIGYSGDIIFHTLAEDDVPRAMALFR